MSSDEEMGSQEEEAEFSDEMLLSDLKSPSPRKRRASQGVSYTENSDGDDDDDDDIPLAALKAPSPKKRKTNGTTTKKKKTTTTQKKASASSRSSSANGNSNISSSTDYRSASDALYGSSCDKGLLIQRLLCRWWYAIVWPNPASLPKTPPPHYDALDGFPGVYVCTQGDEVGNLKDFRDPKECPNFQNLAKKSSGELKELLIQAVEKQREQLIKAEGSGTPTEKELATILRWARKVKASTAEKEAAKVLKAAKLKLVE